MTLDRQFSDDSVFRVCFVCTGNICRSPMAEAVLLSLAEQRGRGGRIRVASAGIGDYHVGEPADHRAIAALDRRGYSATAHRAKQFDADWFALFDLVIALDRGQWRALTSWAPDAQSRAKVKLLMSFDPDAGVQDVPDPYYSDEAFFDEVLDQIEAASRGLYRQIEPALR